MLLDSPITRSAANADRARPRRETLAHRGVGAGQSHQKYVGSIGGWSLVTDRLGLWYGLPRTNRQSKMSFNLSLGLTSVPTPRSEEGAEYLYVLARGRDLRLAAGF